MGEGRKFKIPITILMILILIIYIETSAGVFISFLGASENVELVLIHLMQHFNYIGFGFNTSVALLIIPASILLIININKIDLNIRYSVSQVLSFISLLLMLLSWLIPFLVYLTWLEDQAGVDREIWFTIIPLFAGYFFGLIFNLIAFILLIIKRD